jgi:signal transduction histidine kinase
MQSPATRESALAALADSDPQRRLEAARALSLVASIEDEEQIRRAYRGEVVKWVKDQLEDVLSVLRDRDEDSGESVPISADPSRVSSVSYVTRQIVHEFRHFIARLELSLDELKGYRDGNAPHELERMSDFVDSIADLGSAAAAPRYETFDLAALLFQIAEDQAREALADIDMAGGRPMLCIGDRSLVERIVANGLRNAVESVQAVHSGRAPAPVVLNWGKTVHEYWITILDEGLGPPAGLRRFFRMGVTTKHGHMGMGLAIALRATATIGGKLSLTPRAGHGSCFEIRWPIQVAQDAAADS